MKVLIFSDLHLHNWQNFGKTEDRFSKRLANQVDVLAQIYDIIINQNIKYVEFGGDLFHTVGTVPVPAYNVWSIFYNNLRSAGVKINFTIGNHDIISRTKPYWHEISVHDFIEKAEPVPYKIKRIGFSDEVDVEEIKGYDIVIIHKTPIGVKVGKFEFSEGVDWKTLSKNNKFVFFGHIHQKQQLANNCFVIGSPMQFNFGDYGDRGVWVTDLKFGVAEFIHLKSPKFITVRTIDEVDKDNHYDYFRVLESNTSGISGNIIHEKKPKVFDEEIKSYDDIEILEEYLRKNNKPSGWINEVKDDISRASSDSGIFRGYIREVEIKDFISVGYCKYGVEKGFNIIEGINKDTNGSNGSGKSTIFGESIYWALFGKTSKGLTGNDVIRRGQKDCYVQLIFKPHKGGEDVILRRSRKGGLSLFVNGKDIYEGMKRPDAQKEFETGFLGFSEDLFRTACYFSQEGFVSFMTIGDAGRTMMVSRLLGFEKYDDLYNIVSGRLDELLSEVSEMVRKKEKLENDIKYLFAQVNDLDGVCSGFSNEIKEAEHKVTELNNKLGEVMKIRGLLESELSEVSSKLLYDTSEIDRIKQRIEDTDGLIDDLTNTINKFERAKSSSETKMSYCSKQISNIQDKLSQLKIGSICEYCGSIITEESISRYSKKYESDLSSLRDSLSSEKHLISEYNCKIRSFKDKIMEFKTKKSEFKDQLVKEEAKIRAEYEKWLERKKSLEVEFNDVQVRAKHISKQISDLNSLISMKNNELIKYKNKVENINRVIKGNEAEIVQLNSKINKYREREEILTFWRNAFSNSGIKTLLLARFCNVFNLLLSAMLTEVSSGRMNACLSPVKELKSGETRNALSLDITYDGVKVNYNSLSGGEKRRIDVSVALSLSKWVEMRYNTYAGLLGLVILDEIFSFIDKAGEESIGTQLYHIGEESLLSLFVITHTSELSSYAKRVYTVIKENGISKVQLYHMGEESPLPLFMITHASELSSYAKRVYTVIKKNGISKVQL